MVLTVAVDFRPTNRNQWCRISCRIPQRAADPHIPIRQRRRRHSSSNHITTRGRNGPGASQSDTVHRATAGFSIALAQGFLNTPEAKMALDTPSPSAAVAPIILGPGEPSGRRRRARQRSSERYNARNSSAALCTFSRQWSAAWWSAPSVMYFAQAKDAPNERHTLASA